MGHQWETGFAVGERTWHGQENLLRDHPRDWQEVRRLALGIEWEPVAQPLYFRDSKGEMILVPDTVAQIRDTDDAYLGTVSSTFKTYTNERFFRWWAPLMADDAVRVEVAGSLKAGRQIFALGRINMDPVDIVPGDPVAPYLYRYNMHDGSGAVTTMFSSIRVVCANTHRMAEDRHGRNAIRQRHVGSEASQDAGDRLVHDCMDISRRRFDITVDRYRAMAAHGGFDERALRDYAARVLGIDLEAHERANEERKDAGRSPKKQRRIEKIVEIAETGAGSDIRGVRGSLWGALNAVSEFAHYARGREVDRATQSLTGTGAAIIDRAESVASEILEKPSSWRVSIPDSM